MLSAIFSAATGASLGTLFVRLTADATDLVRGMEQATTSIERSCASILAQVKNLALGVTAAFAIISAVGVREAMKFEDSFAGVRRTVQATDAEYAKLAASFRQMAKEIPINVNEINRIAEAAGQLGIKNENIVGFTRTMAMLGTTIRISSDEAADSMARFANVSQMNQKDFDKLASTLVALDYASASTGKEILEMSLRIVGAGHQIGMSEAQIMSFAAGLSSVGIQAEMGGSAISQLMVRMSEAVANGGEKLQTFAGIAGTTAEKFTVAFKKDATGAILDFIEGLHSVSKAGGNVFNVMDKLGIDGIRMMDLLNRASGAGDLFRQTMETGTKAWEENTAMVDAAEKRYATFSSQLTITWNIFKDLLITVGEQFIPVLKTLNNMLQDVVKTQDAQNTSTTHWIKNIAPAFLTMVGLVGDAIWGWKVIIKAGEVGFLQMFQLVTKAAQAFAQVIADIFAGIGNSIIDTLNYAIRAANKLLPDKANIPYITLDIKFDMSDSKLIEATKILEEAINSSQGELNALIDKGSFSDRLKTEYAKVSKTILDENVKIVNSANATAAELKKVATNFKESTGQWDVPKEMTDQSAAALRQMAMMKPPEKNFGEMKGLHGMEDPNAREMRLIDEQVKDAQKNLKFLETIGQGELTLTKEVQEKKLALVAGYQKKLEILQTAQTQLILSTSSKMFDDLANIAAFAAGKQATVYKTMFAISKAFAIAESVVKIQQGIANAASQEWPANLLAMASVVAATSSIVSTIQQTQLVFGGGKALGGRVQPGSYYNVGESGPERFVPDVSGTIVPNDKLGGGKSGGVKIVVNNYTDAKAEVTEKNEGGERTIEILIKRVKTDIATEVRDGRGDLTKSLESTYNLRRGR